MNFTHMSEQSSLLIGLPTARSHQLANTGRYCERNDAAQRTPPVRCAASIDLRTVATKFCSDGLYAISRNFPVKEFFFPVTGNFFGTRENRVPLISLVYIQLITVWICIHSHQHIRGFTMMQYMNEHVTYLYLPIYTVFRKKTPTHIFFHISTSDV